MAVVGGSVVVAFLSLSFPSCSGFSLGCLNCSIDGWKVSIAFFFWGQEKFGLLACLDVQVWETMVVRWRITIT